MSSSKIKKALQEKNITPVNVEYSRGCPVPGGYADGYDLTFDDETVSCVYELNHAVRIEMYMEFDSVQDVLKWVSTLPAICSPTGYE